MPESILGFLIHRSMKKHIFIFLLPSIFLFSCNGDDILSLPDFCPLGIDSFAEPASEQVDSSILLCNECLIDCQEVYSSEIPYDYYYPRFNPNNPEQLAYYRYGNTEYNVTSEIWVMDFCAGESKMLVDNAFYGLDWSVKGWLIYTANDQNIWKIKSNGDSLMQVTFIGDYNRYPSWSPDGTRIAFNSELEGETYFFILDEIENTIDTIQELRHAGAWSWVDENRICFLTGEYNGSFTTKKLNVFDLQTYNVSFLHDLIIEHSLDSLIINTVSFPSENSIIWCALGFIGKTDLATGTFEILQQRLLQEKFWFVTVRPGEQELLFSKQSVHYAGNCRFDSDWGFYLINKDSSEQRRVRVED